MGWHAVSFDEAAKKRIAEASSFEKKLRLEGLLGLDQELFGFKIRQLTVRDLLHLEFTENRLALGEVPQNEDLIAFVLMLSVDKPFFKKRYLKKLGRFVRDYEVFREEIICCFGAAFNDMPSSDESKSITNESSVSIVTLVDTLSSNYGWTLDQILNTHLSTALQLLQRIMMRSSDKYSMRNPITQRARANEMNKLRRL